jgi:hypothetical protein
MAAGQSCPLDERFKDLFQFLEEPDPGVSDGELQPFFGSVTVK